MVLEVDPRTGVAVRRNRAGTGPAGDTSPQASFETEFPRLSYPATTRRVISICGAFKLQTSNNHKQSTACARKKVNKLTEHCLQFPARPLDTLFLHAYP